MSADRSFGSRAAVVVWLVAVAISVTGSALDAAGVRINSTPSVPIGIWVLRPLGTLPRRGMVVSFCRPLQRRSNKTSARSNDRPCSNRTPPFLKPIVAVAGDRVEVSDRGVAVNGTLIPRTRRIRDNRIPMVPAGRYEVRAGQVWVVSNHHARSFDSRYFGPVDVRQIRSRATAAFVWSR